MFLSLKVVIISISRCSLIRIIFNIIFHFFLIFSKTISVIYVISDKFNNSRPIFFHTLEKIYHITN